MSTKHLDIRTEKNLPMMRRIFAAYFADEPAESIAQKEGISRRMVYHWLGKARELKEGGQL